MKPALEIGTKIRTKCPVYAGLQKQQERNLLRLPSGIEGTVKNGEVNIYGVEFYLVRIWFDEKKFFVKLGPSAFDVVEDR